MAINDFVQVPNEPEKSSIDVLSPRLGETKAIRRAFRLIAIRRKARCTDESLAEALSLIPLIWATPH